MVAFIVISNGIDIIILTVLLDTTIMEEITPNGCRFFNFLKKNENILINQVKITRKSLCQIQRPS
jgi:hypothetical protein